MTDPTLAADLAARDQADASVRDIARTIAVFREELIAGRVPGELADDLTREYGLKLLGVPSGFEEED